MGYNFNMDGEFKFNKEIPKKYKEILLKMNENEQLGEGWYRENFKNDKICAAWCPWKYREDINALVEIDDVSECNHNYWFIDWLAWIIESICIPAGLTLNGSGNWQDDGNYDEREEMYDNGTYGDRFPKGDGCVTITDNKIKTKGTFFGSNDYKKTVQGLNKILTEQEKKV